MLLRSFGLLPLWRFIDDDEHRARLYAPAGLVANLSPVLGNGSPLMLRAEHIGQSFADNLPWSAPIEEGTATYFEHVDYVIVTAL